MGTSRRLVAAVIGIAAFATGPAGAQRLPSFEVVSVKENTSGSQANSYQRPSPGQLRIQNTPLWFILHDAFQLLDHQLIGRPDWSDAPYDIDARFSPATSDGDVRLMLQSLLAERFGLVYHRETRELPLFELVIARKDGKLGPHLVPSDVDCAAWLAEKRPQTGAGGPSPFPPRMRPACTIVASRSFISGGTRTIAQLVPILQALAGRPVVDRTGLTGTFNMDMQWSPTDVATAAGVTTSADTGLSIFTALQEHLGLKLEPARGPFDVVVIDAIRRPTPD